MTGDGWLSGSRHRFGAAGDRLEELCTTCVRNAGVDGAGVTILASDGTPETVYVTSQLAAGVQDLQYTLGVGPGIDAIATGAPVLATDRDLERRWPALWKEIAPTGVMAIFAFPIRIGVISLGTLELHQTSPRQLSNPRLGIALSTVDEIAKLLPALGRHGMDGAVPHTTYRMLVHQAAGMVMMQLDTTIEEALVRLRATAYAEGISINDLAADLVARRRRLTTQERP